MIAQKLLYVISAITHKTSYEEAEGKYFVLQDISISLRVPSVDVRSSSAVSKETTTQIKEFYKAKNNCLLTPYVNELVDLFGTENCFYPCDPETSTLLKRQAATTIQLERKVIPDTIKGFQNSIHYCLQSQLKRYQGLMPQAKPVPVGDGSDEFL